MQAEEDAFPSLASVASAKAKQVSVLPSGCCNWECVGLHNCAALAPSSQRRHGRLFEAMGCKLVYQKNFSMLAKSITMLIVICDPLYAILPVSSLPSCTSPLISWCMSRCLQRVRTHGQHLWHHMKVLIGIIRRLTLLLARSTASRTACMAAPRPIPPRLLTSTTHLLSLGRQCCQVGLQACFSSTLALHSCITHSLALMHILRPGRVFR